MDVVVFYYSNLLVFSYGSLFLIATKIPQVALASKTAVVTTIAAILNHDQRQAIAIANSRTTTKAIMNHRANTVISFNIIYFISMISAYQYIMT